MDAAGVPALDGGVREYARRGCRFEIGYASTHISLNGSVSRHRVTAPSGQRGQGRA
jgi:hypothetical protein